MPAVAPALAMALGLAMLRRGVRAARADRVRAVLGVARVESPAPRKSAPGARTARGLSRRRSLALSATLGVGGLWVGFHLAGIPGAMLCAAGGIAAPSLSERRNAGHRVEELDRQLADLAESIAAAVQSGLSIGQALEYAAAEAPPPLSEVTEDFLAQRRVGVALDVALERMSDRLATDDARLLRLVLGVHHRAGGSVASALSEVTSTIRHRVGLRRELRALTAQGRISGLILGALPVGFFLVLAVTSHRQLAPVYASVDGMAMVGGGFLMEGLAFLWIRRLLRVTS